MSDVLSTFLKIAGSILPVVLFLILLLWADSYKLVALRSVVRSLFAGSCAAIAAYAINVWFFHAVGLPSWLIGPWLAPLTEETLKGIYVFFLVRTARTGFQIDTAIHGFATGAGFALVENSFFLISYIGESWYIWVVRGFGTAVMHGGATASLGILSKYRFDRYDENGLRMVWPGWLLAVALHAAFNHFVLPPLGTTVLALIVWPAVVVIVFAKSENDLREWIGAGIDTDIEVLNLIRNGEVSGSHVGRYIHRFRTYFSKEELADLLCYIRLYVELRLLAKGMLMARERGFALHVNSEARSGFAELRYLEKQLGETGRILLRPFLQKDLRDPWVIERLSAQS